MIKASAFGIVLFLIKLRKVCATSFAKGAIIIYWRDLNNENGLPIAVFQSS
jgi:hypothetical protein